MRIGYKIYSIYRIIYQSQKKSIHWYSYWIYLIKKGSKQHINSLEIDGTPYSNPLKRKNNGTYKIRYSQGKSFITKRSCITNLCHLCVGWSYVLGRHSVWVKPREPRSVSMDRSPAASRTQLTHAFAGLST